jgi:hypothetical protein
VIDVFAVVSALFGVLIATAFVGFPIWLLWKLVAAVRRRLVVPWALRVGDRERAAVARRLGDDYAHGRLVLEELEQRTERAWRAATYADLRAIAHDLPPARRPRAFTAVDLGLAFAAGIVLLGVSAYFTLLLVGGILLRRRLLA